MLVALLLVLVCGATATALVGWALALNRARAAAQDYQLRLAFARLSPSVTRALAAYASIGVNTAAANEAFVRLGRTFARYNHAMREER